MSQKLRRPCRPMQPWLQETKASETSQQTALSEERIAKLVPTNESISIFRRTGNRSNSEVDARPSWQRHGSSLSTSLDTKNPAFKRDTFENLSSPKAQGIGILKLDDSGFDESTACYNTWDNSCSKDFSSKLRTRSSSKKRKGFINSRNLPFNTKIACIPSFNCSKKPQFSKDRDSQNMKLQKDLIRQVQFPKMSFLEKIRSFI